MPSPRMRVQAIRASETLYKAGNKSFDGRLPVAVERRRHRRRDPGAADAQLVQGCRHRRRRHGRARRDQGARRDWRSATGSRVRRPVRGGGGRGGAFTPEQQDLMERGGAIFNEICFTCHGPDGRGAAARRRGARRDDGAAARGLAAGAGSSRLRHQDLAARTDRARERHDLHAGHGADGHEARTTGSRPSRRTSATASATARRSLRRPMSRACGRRLPHARRAGRSPEIDASLPVPLPPQPAWKVTCQSQQRRSREAR